MSKLVRNLVIGVIIAIVGFIIIQNVGKQSAQRAYDSYLQNEQKTYDIIQVDDDNISRNNFIHNTPYFSLNLPTGLSIIKTIDKNGIVGYVGETDNIMCQIQVIDTYTLMNMKSQNIERRMVDYNMYSKASMDAAYDGLVKSTVSSSPYGRVINTENSVQKINEKIFIYIKYEIPDDDENMIRKSYNFMINGYTITVVGLYFKNDRNAESSVDNLLKSIKFN